MINSRNSVDSIIQLADITILAHHKITCNSGIVGRVVGCGKQGSQADQRNVGEDSEGTNVVLELQHAECLAAGFVDEAAGKGLLSASHVNPRTILGDGVLVHAAISGSVEEGHGKCSGVTTLRELEAFYSL